MSVATGTAIAIAVGAGTAGAGIYAANKTSGAADNAAQLQSTAAAQALAFQKQQAQADYQNQEVNRKANYEQFAARDQRIGTLGEAVGLPARQTPAYVPSVDPQYVHNGGTPPTGAQAQLQAAGVNPAAYGSTASAATTQPGTPSPAAPASSGPMVQLKSPTGQISSVPRSQVLHYLSLGASYV